MPNCHIIEKEKHHACWIYGLGNVSGKISGSLLHNDVELTVHDLNVDLVAGFVNSGATAGGQSGSCDAKLRDCYYLSAKPRRKRRSDRKDVARNGCG